MILLCTLFITLLYFLWYLFAHGEGSIEGLLFHCNTKANDELKKDYHPEFTFKRAVVFTAFIIPVILISLKLRQPFTLICYAIALICSYLYIHVGRMFAVRNDYNPLIYIKRWKADPSSKNHSQRAKRNYPYKTRLKALYVGITAAILSIILIFVL